MLLKNLQKIRSNITEAALRAGRTPSEIVLVAVTKTVGPGEVGAASELGLRNFAENRLQEAKPKLKQFPALRWHFIGHLQSNKVKEVLTAFSLIHSLDRLSLASALQRRAELLEKEARCLVQLNVSGEKSKFGLGEEELSDFLDAMRDYPRVKIEGLMTMAPYYAQPEEARPIFRHMRRLQKTHARPGVELKELSMGMTNDYIVAIEEGATMVRIGTALFGERRS